MNRPDDLLVLRAKREARFAELNAMSKTQLAQILRLHQEGGASCPILPSSYMTKTKAELIWLLVDAEIPTHA